MAKRPDRRVARTRRMLTEAFLGLIVEKGYSAVTVQDIIDRADVGRSTFYAHFSNKEQVVASALDGLHDVLGGHQNKSPGSVSGMHSHGFGFVRPLFDHIRERLPAHRALMGHRGAPAVQERVRRMLTQLVAADLEKFTTVRGLIPREFVVRFVVGALHAVIEWWTETGGQLSPAELEERFRKLVMSGVAGLKGT